MSAPPVVLASRSPARARLLRAAGITFTQLEAAINEVSVRDGLRAEGVQAEDAAVILAELKARRVADQIGPGAIVLGSDSIVDVDGEWPEKPMDRAAARAQLLRLRGRRHRLVSAAVGCRGEARVWHHVETAQVWMRPFSDAFLDEYLDEAGAEVLGSVGAYHLEGRGAQLMARIDGDFFTILGLPLLSVLQFLRDQDVLRT